MLKQGRRGCLSYVFILENVCVPLTCSGVVHNMLYSCVLFSDLDCDMEVVKMTANNLLNYILYCVYIYKIVTQN